MITTYIENKDYYEYNRVFIVSKISTKYVTGRIVYLDTWKTNSVRFLKSEFFKMFEISPIQYSS